MKEIEVSIQFRMPENIHAKLKKISQSQLRSLNAQILFFVREGIRQYENESGEIELHYEDL